MGDISRLEAINTMRLYAGQRVLSDLEGSDTELASFILDRTTRDYQVRGLVNNTLVVEVQPDEDGHILLRGDALEVRLLSIHYSQTLNARIAAVSNSNTQRLFNQTDMTDEWPADTYCLEYILKVEWENMSTSVQIAMITAASRHYQMLIQGDQATDLFLASLEMESMLRAGQQDAQQHQRTIFTSVLPSMQAVLSRTIRGTTPGAIRRW